MDRRRKARGAMLAGRGAATDETPIDSRSPKVWTVLDRGHSFTKTCLLFCDIVGKSYIDS